MLLSQHHVPCLTKSIVFSGERHILTSRQSRQADDVYFCKVCLSQPSRQKDVQARAYQNPYAVPVQPGRDRAFTIKLALAKSSGRLDLSWMGLESLDPEIFELTDLEDLTLAGNRLRQLPEELAKLKNLKNLQAAGNLLDSLPQSFTQLTNLSGLWLHGNVLTELPQDLGNLVSLETVSLAGNRIGKLPDSVTQLTKLKDLTLSGNLLKDLPSSIGGLGSLTNLALNGNQLQSLPVELAACTSLKELHLQYNELQQLPEELNRLQNLKELNVSDNKLSGLPETWAGLQSCESIWLYGNRLTALPKDLLTSPKLECLWVENNPLEASALQKQLESLPRKSKLRELGLSAEQASSLDPGLEEKSYIKTGKVPAGTRGYFKLRHAGKDHFNAANAANVLVITFASAPGTPNWGGLLGKYVQQASQDESQFDILYVCDGSRSWYAAGDEGYKFWETEIARVSKQYGSVIMLGDSMGASAALLFSHLATTVQAFTPQVDLANASIRPGQYQDWLNDGKARILESVKASKANIKVHTGTWDHDLEQAKLLPSEKCELVVHHLDSHRLAIALHREGQLLPIIRRSILSELGLYSAPRLVNLL